MQIRTGLVMQTIQIVVSFFVLNSCQHQAALPKPNEVIWKSVAKSDFVVLGLMTLDQQALTTQRGEYIVGEIAPSEKNLRFLKGHTKGRMLFRYFNENTNYGSVNRERVQTLIGQHVLAFLQTNDGGNYLIHTGDYALQPASPLAIEAVQLEIERQQSIIDKWQPNPAVPHFERVGRLIESALSKEEEDKSFQELESLGASAVPAIILHLEDRRPLPRKYIRLENNFPNAFEAYRQYSPDLMVDALTAILNQITGESYGNIYNGGTEKERRRTINAWKIYGMTDTEFAESRPSLGR